MRRGLPAVADQLHGRAIVARGPGRPDLNETAHRGERARCACRTEVRSLRAQGLCVIAETVEQCNVLSTDLEVARQRSLVGSLSSFVNLPTHLIGVASPLSHGDPARDLRANRALRNAVSLPCRRYSPAQGAVIDRGGLRPGRLSRAQIRRQCGLRQHDLAGSAVGV